MITNYTKHYFDDLKLDLISHFIEQERSIRLSPNLGSTGYSDEEAMIRLMYVQTEMPYILAENSEVWDNEVVVTLQGEIPAADKVLYLEEELRSYKEENDRMYNAIYEVSEKCGVL